MSWNLEGQNILLSGGSGSIGRAMAEEFARLGAEITLTGRDASRLKALVKSLPGQGHRAVVVTYPEDLGRLKQLFREAAKTKKFNHFVSATGALEVLPVRSVSLAHLAKLVNLNFYSVAMEVQAFRSSLVSDPLRPRGIVAVSSIASTSGQLGLAGYGASKAALESFIKASARELARENIRINSLRLGLVDSQMHKTLTQKGMGASDGLYPLGLGHPSDAAAAAAFLIMDASKWITGTSMIIDGGFSSGK